MAHASSDDEIAESPDHALDHTLDHKLYNAYEVELTKAAVSLHFDSDDFDSALFAPLRTRFQPRKDR